ncbi:hypothetical protein ES705_17750 [subsurface metagenome]
MALTDDSDIVIIVHEDALNRIIKSLMFYRPSLFNYATPSIIANEKLHCIQIDHAPDIAKIFSEEEPLPVPGSNKLYKLEYCFQISDVVIDFYPRSSIVLPDEIGTFSQHMLSMKAKVCGAIACPGEALLTFPPVPDPLTQDDIKEGKELPEPTVLPVEKLDCFCLELYALCGINLSKVNNSDEYRTSVQMHDIEIVDITPDNLESNLECMIMTMFHLVISPKMALMIEKQTFEIFNGAYVSFKPAETGLRNPTIDNDELTLLIDMEVTS